MRRPAFQRRALDRIEQTLVAEDPGLGLRYAVFARLTRHEAMPGTERIPGRLQRLLRPALILPLMLISLVAVLAAGWLTSSVQACTVGAIPATHGMSQVSRAARCQPGPAIKQDQVRMH
jgi:hypothetical protein